MRRFSLSALSGVAGARLSGLTGRLYPHNRINPHGVTLRHHLRQLFRDDLDNPAGGLRRAGQRQRAAHWGKMIMGCNRGGRAAGAFAASGDRGQGPTRLCLVNGMAAADRPGEPRTGRGRGRRRMESRCCSDGEEHSFSVQPASHHVALLRRLWLARQPARSEHRLLVRRRRQLPGAGGRRAHVGVDVHVEQERLVGCNRVLQRALEVLRLGDGQRIDAAGLGPAGEVGVVGLLVGARSGTWCRARGRRTCRAGCRGSTPSRSCSRSPTPRGCCTRPPCTARAAPS